MTPRRGQARVVRLVDGLPTMRPDLAALLLHDHLVRRGVREPIFDASVNILGSLNLLECAVARKTRRFIYISTAGAGYGEGFGANSHRFAPTGMMAAVAVRSVLSASRELATTVPPVGVRVRAVGASGATVSTMIALEELAWGDAGLCMALMGTTLGVAGIAAVHSSHATRATNARPMTRAGAGSALCCRIALTPGPLGVADGST